MNKPKIVKLISRLALMSPLLVAGCTYLYVEYRCHPLTGCGYEVGIEGVFCPEGGTAPTEEECGPPEDPPQLLPFQFGYATNYGIAITANWPFGVMELYENEVLDTVWSVPFTTTVNTQYVTDPDQLEAAVEAAMTSSTSSYSFALKPPAIDLTTGAPEGATVMLTATLTASGFPIAASTTSFEAGPGGGLPTIDDEIGDP